VIWALPQMAIFSRRTIQELIDQSAKFLPLRQTQRHTRNLEDCSDNTIPTEWELAILVAFSKLGTVFAEPETGSTRPDLLFTPRGGTQSILLEIGTVSDKHLHQNNPFDQLMEDFGQRLRKEFPDRQLGRFHVDVRQLSPLPTYRGERVTQHLRLPKPHEFKRTIFSRRFDKFLASIKNVPTQAHEYAVKDHRADVTIRFEPGARGLSAGHPVYTLAHSKTSNPVANVLHSKAKQLKSSTLPGPYGIILCDGDCDLLSRRHTNDWSSFSLEEVVRHFFRQNTSIAFVSVLTVVTDNSGRIGPRNLRLHHRLFQNEAFRSLDPAMQESVLKFHSELPPPARTPVNARNHLNWVLQTGKPERGNSFEGGYSMSARSLKISLRVVQELLAGKTEMKTFQDTHGFPTNPFLRNLEQGCLITKIDVEKGAAGEDDDWINFTFGDPDPAVSPYRTPKK